MGKFDRFSLNEKGDYEFTIEDLEDEETTLDLAMSSIDGSSQEIGSLTKHPRDRREKSERVAMYAFIAFIFAMFIGLIPLSWKKKSDAFMMAESFKPIGRQNLIQCAGSEKTLTVNEWLGQDMADISALCDPTFLGSSRKADPTRTPVKVFIMMGEANMFGTGMISGGSEGTLEFTVHKKHRFSHLKSEDGREWGPPRNDVRHVALHNDFEIVENNWLTIDEDRGYFGPEIQFGYVMGEFFDEPVLIIKAAQGHASLGGEMLPPGSQEYSHDGYMYAGYADSPRRWEAGSTRVASNSWRAGIKYDQHVHNVKQALRRISDYYPGSSTYEIAG
jgi:hypothetical protein